jgi:molecular chaperone Hsp33
MAMHRRRQETIADDIVLPFKTFASGVIGRVVRLGALADTVLTRHAYAEPVSRALGEALVLASLLGTALKGEGKFILQTKSDGPLGFLVVNFESPGRLRGYASLDAARASEAAAAGEAALLGRGHLAMTIDQGSEKSRYQGIVALSGKGLTAATLDYFQQSEQLPSFLRVAVARHYDGATKAWQWRAGGLMVQYMPPVGVGPKSSEEDERLVGERAEAWNRTRILAATVEDHELIDPGLAPERLLCRLFHEEGVRVMPVVPLTFYCGCSRELVRAFLEGFGTRELTELREPDGAIAVTCEYCTERYRFAPGEIG